MGNEKYLIEIDNKEDYRVISQTGVKQACLAGETLHNASWDSVLSQDGRLFFSLCSELTTSEYAKLAEYSYDDNSIIEHFYSKEFLMPHYRYIRDSKFHTSMSVLPDGSLIMATHTTDKAPEHPAWMPEAYYANPWEGYPGSTLFHYDPKTGKVENLGIPAPRESVYGGVYDARNNNYYMLGFMRGHLYRYSLDTRQVEDLGQVTERHTYRLVVGSDGNIYFSTRSGFLKRINVNTGKVEDLNIQLPHSSEKRKRPRSYMAAGTNGPDGELYIAGQFHDEMSVYDPETGEFKVLGKYKKTEEYIDGISNNDYVGGMAFDSKGVLWYVLSALRHDREEDFKPGCALMRWDIKHGGESEYLGLMGTPGRTVTTTAGVFIDKSRDILYVVGTNHADEGPDVTAVDLSVFEKDMYSKGPISEDAFIYPGNKKYDKHAANLRETWCVIGRNPSVFRPKNIIPIRLWRQLPYEMVEESAVAGLVWKDGVLHGLCGKEKPYCFKIGQDGTLLYFKALENETDDYKVWLYRSMVPKACNFDCSDVQLPFYPGRQYKAVPDMSITISGNRQIVATRDGMVSIVKKGRAFSLGPACSHGSVHCMTATSDGTMVYGVAGDKDDLGNIFTYDDDNGLRWHGLLATDGYLYGNCASYNLTSCTLSDEGNILAVGSGDRLGCVYLCIL